MDKKRKTPKIIIVASIIGIVFSILGFSAAGVEALFMLTIIPLLLCLGLLIKKWWVCGLLYNIVFLYVRSGIFFGRATSLAIFGCLAIVMLFARATVAAYKYKNG